MRQAYCAGTACSVSILGGAEFAKRVLKEIPGNWHVLPFDAIAPREFLVKIDFFVHYPNERCMGSFDHAPLEAMAVGVPVIMPPRFKSLFGAAAIYAEPTSVFGVIHALWADRQTYEAQVARGFAFVEANCNPALFQDRTRGYLSLPAALVEPTKRTPSIVEPRELEGFD